MHHFFLVILFSLGLPAFAADAAAYKIVTASERGTYIQIGRDIAKWVAEPAGINLEVLPSKGSTENVSRMRYEPGVKFALVQSDVYQAMLDAAQSGSASAAQMIRPLRVIMPLYDEEIYFVTRADSPLKYIHELKGKKINIGPVGSGTALSATTLYRQMFGQALEETNTSYLSNEEALVKLASDKSIDAVVVVAGQPAKLFVDMTPDARRFIKFLRLDPGAEATTLVKNSYFPAVIKSSSYPNWITEDIPTLTVKAFLVTYDYNTPQIRKTLAAFSESLCQNFSNLQTHGHPKWKQVRLELPALGKGWRYYPPTERILRRCISTADRPVQPRITAPSGRSCSQADKVLGLCSN